MRQLFLTWFYPCTFLSSLNLIQSCRKNWIPFKFHKLPSSSPSRCNNGITKTIQTTWSDRTKPWQKRIQFFYKSKGSDLKKYYHHPCSKQAGQCGKVYIEMTKSYYWVEDDRVVISNFKGFGKSTTNWIFWINSKSNQPHGRNSSWMQSFALLLRTIQTMLVETERFLESNGVLLLPPWDIGLLLMVFK